MAHGLIGRMEFIRRRRLLVRLLSEAIEQGRLPADSVDLVALLFGDEPTWAGIASHAEIVRTILEQARESGRIAPDKSSLGAAGLVKRAVFDAIVAEMDLGEAARRHGRGDGYDDVAYRGLRPRIDDYVDYLLEACEYRRLADDVRRRYASRSADEPVVRRASRSDKDLQAAQAWVAEFEAEHGSAFDAQGTATTQRARGNPLLDKLGRTRWPADGARRRAKPGGDLLRDQSVLQARLGLTLNQRQRAALPSGWEMHRLSERRIVELLPYPRSIHINKVLEAFGHSPWRTAADVPAELVPILEGSASPCREALLAQVNTVPPLRVIGMSDIPDRWWRARDFYWRARAAAGETMSAPIWPEPFDYLWDKHFDIYTEDGLWMVQQLDALVEITQNLTQTDYRNWSEVLHPLKYKSEAYQSFISIAEGLVRFSNLPDKLTMGWLTAVRAADINILLPRFDD
jgi:hypothetical protein